MEKNAFLCLDLPLEFVAALFCFVMREISCCLRQTKTYIIEAFNSTSRYLDVLLNIDAPYFEQMVGQIFLIIPY